MGQDAAKIWNWRNSVRKRVSVDFIIDRFDYSVKAWLHLVSGDRWPWHGLQVESFIWDPAAREEAAFAQSPTQSTYYPGRSPPSIWAHAKFCTCPKFCHGPERVALILPGHQVDWVGLEVDTAWPSRGSLGLTRTWVDREQTEPVPNLGCRVTAP